MRTIMLSSMHKIIRISVCVLSSLCLLVCIYDYASDFAAYSCNHMHIIMNGIAQMLMRIIMHGFMPSIMHMLVHTIHSMLNGSCVLTSLIRPSRRLCHVHVCIAREEAAGLFLHASRPNFE